MNEKKLNFVMIFHCHQPVGNFDQVMEEAYEKAYLPFLNILKNHPGIKVTLHYSGSLLDWIQAKKKEFLKILKDLSEKGQIEFMSGGYYEPILSLIPDGDKLAQIGKLTRFIKKNFSKKVDGLWLTERIWEPYFVKILAQAGVVYTVVDDTHFKKALGKDEEIYDYYISDNEYDTIFIFPGSEQLRYMLPFKLPCEAIAYLRQARDKGAGCVSFADDGEKFGLWPKTYKWVYEEKWLDNFFTALEENSSWLNVTTPGEVIKSTKPKGRIYLPCASYREMLEWSGGYFNNFLVKYPEANWMQKRMLYLSEELSRIKTKNRILDKAKEHLYMAQCNCPYWHGIFGGLYLGYLRHSVYSNLIAAEKLKAKLPGQKNLLEQKILDIDKDGSEEIVIKNELIDIFVSPERGGAILELDYKPKSLNLSNTLSRRRESYHEKILKLAASGGNPGVSSSPQSIHDLTLVKEGHLEDYLVYDNYPRVSLIEHFLKELVSASDFSKGRYAEKGNFINKVFDYKIKSAKNDISLDLSSYGLVNNKTIKLNKIIRILKDKARLEINYSLENQTNEVLETRFGPEFNFYLHNLNFKNPGSLEKIDFWDFQDDWYGMKIKYRFSQPADLIYFPVETVSDSESGMERNYQGLSQIFFWPLRLNPYKKSEIGIVLILSH